MLEQGMGEGAFLVLKKHVYYLDTDGRGPN